ncbi:LytR/AlgR family response regulator transcription factor [Rhodoflexus caldus]|uniref:LytR/AlgR family response regulator transcription factor n=1 Tax=Rhodoflexus caldus TaxID=2891236 RepID=UPI00202A2AE1|nr:response regulator [Rhodoflexus caldus]
MEIFILEDDPPFARGLADQLGKWNHTVAFHARSYEEAVEWLANTQQLPDAAILDLCLGDEDNREGFDVAELLAEKYHVPFIFYSGLDDGSTARLVDQYEAEHFAKGDIRSLKNALIRIQARNKHTPKQTSYDTAHIRITDTENRGVELFIPIAKIVWIDTQAGNRASRIELRVTDGKKITSYKNGHTLSSFLEELDKEFPQLNLSNVFIRINKYTIINKHYISKRVSDEIYLGEKSFTIGDTYKEELKKYLPPKI